MEPTFQLDTSTSDDTEDKREIIRGCLSEIVVEVGNRLREAGLSCPIFLTVPNSGDAVAMMATPLDPSDADWARVGDIVRTTISERLNGLRLQNRDMICGAANDPMSTAEITADWNHPMLPRIRGLLAVRLLTQAMHGVSRVGFLHIIGKVCRVGFRQKILARVCEFE
jgi:hypothetical protein